MRKSKKFCITLLLSLALMLSLSVSALAASPRAIVNSLSGSPDSDEIGIWTFSAYNTIVITDTGAYARINASCSPGCSKDELWAYVTLRYPNHTIVNSKGPLSNSYSGCTGMVVSGNLCTGPGWYYADGFASMRVSSGSKDVDPDYTGNLQYPYNGSKTIEPRVLGTNKNGQTYGYMTKSITDSDCPDLVSVVGVDGTIGYVYAIEAFPEVKSMSAREASALMTNREYIQGRLVNLYTSDGSTIIGQYLAGGLIGVTVQELGESGEIVLTRTYNEDGTIVTTYADGTKNIIRWK